MPESFAVYDPAMSAHLARSEFDLGWICAKLGVASDAKKRGEALIKNLELRLFDANTARFGFYDAVAQRAYAPDILAGYMPLLLPLSPLIRDALIHGLREYTMTQCPLPTTGPSNEAFDPKRYWRRSQLDTLQLAAGVLPARWQRSTGQDSGGCGTSRVPRVLPPPHR